jgi:hypothetical protein
MNKSNSPATAGTQELYSVLAADQPSRHGRISVELLELRTYFVLLRTRAMRKFHLRLLLQLSPRLVELPAGQRQLERSGCSKNVNSDKHWILLLSGRFEPHPITNRAVLSWVLCRIKKNIGFGGEPKAQWTITSLNSNYEK